MKCLCEISLQNHRKRFDVCVSHNTLLRIKVSIVLCHLSVWRFGWQFSLWRISIGVVCKFGKTRYCHDQLWTFDSLRTNSTQESGSSVVYGSSWSERESTSRSFKSLERETSVQSSKYRMSLEFFISRTTTSFSPQQKNERKIWARQNSEQPIWIFFTSGKWYDHIQLNTIIAISFYNDNVDNNINFNESTNRKDGYINRFKWI